MTSWIAAILAGLAAAALQYGRAAASAQTLPLAALRALVVAIVVALLLGAPAGRARAPALDVAIDASESFTRATEGDACWRAAQDSAAAIGGVRLRFGETVREQGERGAPLDRASLLRPVADRAAGPGRPVVVVTDGELDDGELLATLPRGSRAVVIPCRRGPDAAVAGLEAPRAVLAGDSATVRIAIVAGGRGAPPGRLAVRLDDALLESVPIDALAPVGERSVELRAVAGGPARRALLRAVYSGAGDVEPRNDTLALGVEVTRAPSAVFVSTAPDYDAREAIAALRGVTSLPTRAYYRVAPGAWRADGALTRVAEGEVRSAVAAAPLVVLHGDTGVFGAPRAMTRASLLLFAPPDGSEGEWFARAVPASPLAMTLGALPFDSLPPIDVAAPATMARGQWQGLLASRAGAPADRRAALVGWDEPRRIAVLGAGGLWRWRFGGGTRADAYNAFFGALYDWLAAGPSDRRAAMPQPEVLRAGSPLRWRRGAPADSVVPVTLRRRGATGRVLSLTLRFPEGAAVAESPPVPAGLYDAQLPGGSTLLAVNASRELVPRRPTVRSGEVGGAPAAGEPPLLRDKGWLYALAIAGLCVEWLVRRRRGLR